MLCRIMNGYTTPAKIAYKAKDMLCDKVTVCRRIKHFLQKMLKYMHQNSLVMNMINNFVL